MLFYKPVISLLSGLLVCSSVLAQDDSGEVENPCTVEPVYHCAESMGGGGYIGHFGYRATCPEGDEAVEEAFIEIGDDNYFLPEPIDRGQPKVFVAGEHVDEFEAEFSAAEIEKGGDFSWTVLKIRIPVDLAKTKDASLDCANLPY